MFTRLRSTYPSCNASFLPTSATPSRAFPASARSSIHAHPPEYPATLLAQVFLCGALLGRAGHRLVLHLSASWGGLQPRIPLLENILSYGVPTSPKLHSGLAT